MRRRFVHLLQTDCFHIRFLTGIAVYPSVNLPVHTADYLAHCLIIRILCTERAGKVFKLVTGQDGSTIAERLFVEGRRHRPCQPAGARTRDRGCG